MKKLKISVIGLGYIGLPTAALLAHNNYQVTGYDIDQNIVNTVNSGKVHIVEPDLENYVSKAVSNGLLIASNTLQPADIFIICVPTPFRDKDGDLEPNIDYVMDAAHLIGPLLKEDDIVILESTSPVGTTEKIANILSNFNIVFKNLKVAYCPERVLPGKIMQELIENNRIVGGINSDSTKKVAKFYKTFVRGNVLETNSRTAEMCKLTENSFRDVNIAFANELSMICDKSNINVSDLIELANLHPRVDILQPGPGVGGHCIAVDPWFIVSQDRQNSNLIRTARQVNDRKKIWVIDKILGKIELFSLNNNRKPTVTCLGL